MNKKSIITMMLALVTMAGQAQTKTATVTGYSPALKDGTLVLAGTGTIGNVVDTVQAGRFAFTLPVEELTEGFLGLMGEGCPNFNLTLFLRPGVTVKLTGNDCFYPLWKVESPLSEQQTQSRITEYCRDVVTELMQMDLDKKPWEEREIVEMKWMKQRMDILPSLPVDAATIRALWGISMTAKNTPNFPHMEQLKQLEKKIVARAPKGFEEQLAEIHNYVYPPRLLQVGDEAIDAELLDMQGQKHHLFETFSNDKYVLLDFWGIGCGPCMMSEPEMREVYEKMKDKLEIVAINQNKLSEWQKHEFSKRIVGKNWNNAMKDISSRYCDVGAIPYYVMISPDKRIVWKAVGYQSGYFLGMAEALNGPKQDNSSNLQFAIRKVETKVDGTTISFRYYGHKDYWFRTNNSRWHQTRREQLYSGESLRIYKRVFRQHLLYRLHTYLRTVRHHPRYFRLHRGRRRWCFRHPRCFYRMTNYEEANYHYHPPRSRPLLLFVQAGDSCMRQYNTFEALKYYQEAYAIAKSRSQQQAVEQHDLPLDKFDELPEEKQDEIIEHLKQSAENSSIVDCMVQMKLANCHYKRGNYRETANLLKLVPEDSLSHDAFRQLCFSYQKQGDNDSFIYWASQLNYRYPMDEGFHQYPREQGTGRCMVHQS